MKDLPIIDYHCHVSPYEIAENRSYSNASRGLGQGMAIGLAKAGATVIGAGVSEMKETKEKIEALGGIFHSVQADLSSE